MAHNEYLDFLFLGWGHANAIFLIGGSVVLTGLEFLGVFSLLICMVIGFINLYMGLGMTQEITKRRYGDG